MKCLFLSAARYSLNNSVIKGFESNGWSVRVVDYLDFFNRLTNRFMSKTSGWPDKIRKNWAKPYTAATNNEYYRIFTEYEPDLVFIYNNQLVAPDLIEAFSKKAKIAFYLGDNPFYTDTSPYNAYILFFADYIICPDTFWVSQLSRIGIKNLYFDCLGFDPDLYSPTQHLPEQLKQYESEIVYIGGSHAGNKSYKRFLFLDHFKSFDCKFYITGRGYKKHWRPFFPDLNSKIIEHNYYDSSFNNVVYNCSKIVPCDLPPSLFNGVHIRIFDALGSGVFPLCEYSKDLDIVFEGIEYPVIKRYSEIQDVVSFLLNNDQERRSYVEQMRRRVVDRYSAVKVIYRLIEHVFGSKHA